MKVEIKTVLSESEEGAEIRVVSVTDEIKSAVDLLENNRRNIPVIDEERTVLCPLELVYYIESVDKQTFVYTKSKCLDQSKDYMNWKVFCHMNFFDVQNQ